MKSKTRFWTKFFPLTHLRGSSHNEESRLFQKPWWEWERYVMPRVVLPQLKLMIPKNQIPQYPQQREQRTHIQLCPGDTKLPKIPEQEEDHFLRWNDAKFSNLDISPDFFDNHTPTANRSNQSMLFRTWTKVMEILSNVNHVFTRYKNMEHLDSRSLRKLYDRFVFALVCYQNCNNLINCF